MVIKLDEVLELYSSFYDIDFGKAPEYIEGSQADYEILFYKNQAKIRNKSLPQDIDFCINFSYNGIGDFVYFFKLDTLFRKITDVSKTLEDEHFEYHRFHEGAHVMQQRIVKDPEDLLETSIIENGCNDFFLAYNLIMATFEGHAIYASNDLIRNVRPGKAIERLSSDFEMGLKAHIRKDSGFKKFCVDSKYWECKGGEKNMKKINAWLDHYQKEFGYGFVLDQIRRKIPLNEIINNPPINMNLDIKKLY